MYTKHSRSQALKKKIQQGALNNLLAVEPPKEIKQSPRLLVNKLSYYGRKVLNTLLYARNKQSIVSYSRAFFAKRLCMTPKRVSQTYAELAELGLIDYKQWSYNKANVFKISDWFLDPEVRRELGGYFASLAQVVILPLALLFSNANLKFCPLIKRSLIINFLSYTSTVRMSADAGTMDHRAVTLGMMEGQGGRVMSDEKSLGLSPFWLDDRKGLLVGGIQPPVTKDTRPSMKGPVFPKREGGHGTSQVSSKHTASSKGYTGSLGERPLSQYVKAIRRDEEIKKMTVPASESKILMRRTKSIEYDITLEEIEEVRTKCSNAWEEIMRIKRGKKKSVENDMTLEETEEVRPNLYSNAWEEIMRIKRGEKSMSDKAGKDE